jgi:tetratricopeptide (TPR) repeat protein
MGRKCHLKKGYIAEWVNRGCQVMPVLRSISQGSFLILCLIIIVGLSLLLPNVFVLAKVEKDVAPGNVITVYNKGQALYNSGNYTGAILYYDKALAIDPHYVNALTGKGLALDDLGNYTGAILYYDIV